MSVSLIIMFFLNSISLGIGLAMDAFSVSIANVLNEPEMKKRKMVGMALTYGLFQFFMPMIGWVCVHTIVEKFKSFQKFIPWIALILLLYIGGKMLIASIMENKAKKSEEENKEAGEGDAEKNGTVKVLTLATLLIQGLATSIDALSVGFTISDYKLISALACCFIIGLVTFAISFMGAVAGKKLGEKFTGKAGITGGIILIAIGIEIFVKGFFFPG